MVSSTTMSVVEMLFGTARITLVIAEMLNEVTAAPKTMLMAMAVAIALGSGFDGKSYHSCWYGGSYKCVVGCSQY